MTDIARRYQAVREATATLSTPLAAEDMAVQPMPDASPTKWHLAHTTWFFETFILKGTPNYRPFHPQFEYLFNSYYNTLGPQWYRPHRGLLTRPTVAEILEYRAHVDAGMGRLLESGTFPAAVVELGLNHEQQHQELMLTDVKYLLSQNPLRPVYREDPQPRKAGTAPGAGWFEGIAGIHPIGYEGAGFAFDNEYPRHDELIRPFRIADRLVTNAEYLEFIADGGYRRAELWLSDGGRSPRGTGRQAAISWRVGGFTLSPVVGRRSSSVTCGSGPAAPTSPIPDIARWRVRWASTTRSSCAISSCCGAARAPAPRRISGRPTATFSLPTPAGNSAGFD